MGNQLNVLYLPNLNVYIGKNLQQSNLKIMFELNQNVMQ